MPVEPVPCAPGEGGTPGTCACAPSIASAPLCRTDGTTVLLVIRSECADCGSTAVDPAVVGWLDPATGAYTPGAAPADAGPCTLGCSCSPSITTAPLCRADGTTIMVVVRSDCADCDTPATDPAVVGWLDPLTGVFTPGPAPADAGPCDPGCVDTVCRQLCDDTDGDGEADATYSELWCIKADGTASLVLTYQDDPSIPYTPVSPVACTYGSVETETVTLCDASGPFLRRFTWLNGVGSYEDVALDGQTPHIVNGTVGVCSGDGGSGTPCAAQTTPTAAPGLCLADGTPIAVILTRDCAGTVTQDGWINLTTGTYSTGAPPAGAAACGDSRAFELAGVLCDVNPATGDVLGLALVEYEYNPDGSLASVRLVDPGTGNTYTLQGQLRFCPAGEDGQGVPESDVVVLCDTAPDGTVTTFLRDFHRDANGQVTGHTDYALNGTPYTAAGTVGLCSAPAEPCRNSTALLLCDLPTGGAPTATVTDTNPTPYYPYATGSPVAGAQALWNGGTLTLPAGTSPQPGTTGRVNSLAATIQAPRPACDTGTAHITVSVKVQQTGPDNGCAQTGHLRLFNGTTQTALALLPANTPNGYFGTLTVEADVPAADLASGSIAVALALDAYDDNPACAPSPRRTGWQLSAFTATVIYDQAGCAHQFLRSVATDCETGAVVAVTDTTLDGQPYTVTGDVGQCSPTSGGDGGGGVPEPCRNTSTVLLCDSADDVPATPTVTDTALVGAGGSAPPPVTVKPLPGPYTALWSGGSLTFPSEPNGAAGDGQQIYRAATGVLKVAETCDGGTATVTVSVRVENLGPGTGQGSAGGMELWNGTSRVAGSPPLWNTPPNQPRSISLTGDVPVADLTAGKVTVVFWLETFQGTPKSWRADQFKVTATLHGCPVQFLRHLTVDCETGAVVAVEDSTLDGQPYTVTGDVGQCQASGGDCCPPPPPEECPAHTVLTACRCDDTTGDGTADTEYAELLAVDCDGTLTSIGTYTPDLSAPYAPVAPVACETGAEGAPPTFGVQARRVELAPSGSWSAAAWPTLQSVTAIAHGGTGTITTADGPSTLHTGEAATWSVARDDDARLTGPLVIAADTGTVTVTFTTGVQL